MQTRLLVEDLSSNFVEIDKNSKVKFYYIVLLLGITVTLLIKNSKKITFNIEKVISR